MTHIVKYCGNSGSHGGESKQSVLCVTSCSLTDMYRNFGGTCGLHLRIKTSSTLKLVAASFSKTLVSIYQIKRRHTPEDCEILKY
jgi:hypothetical protein